MSDSSDGVMDTEEESGQVNTQTKKKSDKRKRNPNSPTVLNQEQIQDIIGIQKVYKKNKTESTTQKALTSTQGTSKNYNPTDKNNINESTTPPRQIEINNSTTTSAAANQRNSGRQKNTSAKMKEIINQHYEHLYYISTPDNITRTAMSDIWETCAPNSKDAIFKTKKGFLLKTNQNKNIVTPILNQLIQSKAINGFQETTHTITSQRDPEKSSASYSAVIGSVEHDIVDTDISEFLNKIKINHRYCRRIVSRATNAPTLLVRIITGCMDSFERLLSQGLYYKHRYYPVYPSLPPAPVPQPCPRCLEFTHTKEQCTTPIKCTKCNGKHHYSKCDSLLPPRCSGCGAEDHAAWSMKCPKRPTRPIEGIPNAQIKSLNKKSEEIDKKVTKNSKIHSPITIHDSIINTYITKLNKEKHTNREALISKLRKRFVTQYNIDSVATFSGNRLYILMFDLDQPMTVSPTEPIQGIHNVQIHVDA